MCDAAILEWLSDLNLDIAGKKVLEVGSWDINGTVRSILEPLNPSVYIGIDLVADKPGVDKILDCIDLVQEYGSESFDLVISSEAIEHMKDWEPRVMAMAEVTRDHLLITTRSEGFGHHVDPNCDPPICDYWRFSSDTMHEIATRLGFYVADIRPDWQAPGIFLHARKLSKESRLDFLTNSPTPAPIA